MKVKLKVWRQKNASAPGKLVEYKLANIDPDMSFLEVFVVLNDELTHKVEGPVTFNHDCDPS